jgi:hypothetical protein
MMDKSQTPRHDKTIVPLSNFEPRGFGFVLHSIAIIFHEVRLLHRCTTAAAPPTASSICRHTSMMGSRYCTNAGSSRYLCGGHTVREKMRDTVGDTFRLRGSIRKWVKVMG